MITPYSARTAITQAYSVDLQGTSDFTPMVSGGRSSSLDKIASRYEAGIVIAAVEAQERLRHWLLWSYGPAFFASLRSNQEGAAQLVADHCCIEWESLSEPSNQRTQALIYLHMDNYRALAVTGAHKYRKPAHFAAALQRLTNGVLKLDLSNYQRDYGYLAEVVHAACEHLDKVGLGPVAKVLPRISDLQGVA